MRIATVVYEVLGPTLERIQSDMVTVKNDVVAMKNDMLTIKNEMSFLSQQVSNLTVEMLQHRQEFASQFDLVSYMSSEIDLLNSKLVEMNSSMSGESECDRFRYLNTSMELEQALNSRLESLDELIRDDFNYVKTQLGGVSNTLSDKVEEHDSAMAVELMEMKENLTKHITGGYTCGGTGGWRRVVYLDMNSNTDCPSGWRLFTGNSKRFCGRANSSSLSCDSVFFPVTGGPYNQVCGSIRAYQSRLPHAFNTYSVEGQTTLDSAYVSGVGIMHGSP